MLTIEELLQQFKDKNNVSGKGALSVMLVVTRLAKNLGLPLNPNSLKTEKQGQVKGLSRSAVQNILKDYDIDQILAAEGGRTSRGSLQFMENYVEFLNAVNKDSRIDLDTVESWWIDKVKEFLSGKPFKLKIDTSKSVANVVSDLISQAEQRQHEGQGTMIVGALMQHLVGAKLSLALPDNPPESHGFSVADDPSSRPGDFVIEDVVIHVTATPTESLLKKCLSNLLSGLRPVIVTTSSGVISGKNLSKGIGIEGRVDFFDIEQFITMNIYELSRFVPAKRGPTVLELVELYNTIVKECETDYAMLQIKMN